MLKKTEKIVVEKKSKKDKKVVLEKKPSKFKTFFFGVGKEFERTTWTPKTKLVSDFLVVILVVGILAAIFTGISILMVTVVK